MHYELMAWLHDCSIFEDEYFIVKKRKYSYSEISDVSRTGHASSMTNAVITIKLKNKKTLICVYDRQCKDAGDAVFTYLKELVTNQNRELIAAKLEILQLRKICMGFALRINMGTDLIKLGVFDIFNLL